MGRKASSTKLSNGFHILVCQHSDTKVISKSWSWTIQSSVPQPDVYYIISEAPLSPTGPAVWNSSFVAIMEHLHPLCNFWFTCLHFSYVWNSFNICSLFRIGHDEKLRSLGNNSFICAECLLAWTLNLFCVWAWLYHECLAFRKKLYRFQIGSSDQKGGSKLTTLSDGFLIWGDCNIVGMYISYFSGSQLTSGYPSITAAGSAVWHHHVIRTDSRSLTSEKLTKY